LAILGLTTTIERSVISPKQNRMKLTDIVLGKLYYLPFFNRMRVFGSENETVLVGEREPCMIVGLTKVNEQDSYGVIEWKLLCLTKTTLCEIAYASDWCSWVLEGYTAIHFGK